ncbi:unnamed protein product [Dovyalis caffra]|uniref:V-type proton ATPase subunit G n=1 Tax=Dovyalis caffra TaxID=77055 RepID=A0AAV1S1P0_9ROSI|nr:unnamed protein product [Dovyalis caffra]
MQTKRLRQAKEEAEKEAALYRSNWETEHQKTLDETNGNSGLTAGRLEEETEAKIQNLKNSASKVQSDIADMLVNYVTAIRIRAESRSCVRHRLKASASNLIVR